MLKPAQIKLELYQGVDFWDAFRIGDANAGVYTNTAGFTARLEVSPEGDYDAPPAVLLTTENGGITLGVDGITLAETTLAAAAAKGATTVTVASAAGISVGDRIDIGLTGNLLVATTHVADLAGTTVTLAKALPDAADSGASVWVTDAAGFGMYNVLLYMPKGSKEGGTGTSALTEWGEGAYTLDLIDPYGRARRMAQHIAVLQEGDTA